MEPFAVEPDPAEGDMVAIRRATTLFEEYVTLQRRMPPEVVQLVQATEQPDRRAFTIAAHLAVKHAQRQELLETPSLAGLYDRLVELLEQERELLRLERKIEDDVRGSLFRNQREFFLQEQLKAIHKELGQEDGTTWPTSRRSWRRRDCPRRWRRARSASCAGCGDCRQPPRKAASRAACWTGCWRCRGTSATTARPTSRVPARCSTRITTAWTR